MDTLQRRVKIIDRAAFIEHQPSVLKSHISNFVIQFKTAEVMFKVANRIMSAKT